MYMSKNFKKEFLFCKPLKLNTRAEEVLEAVNDFFNENGSDWGNLVGITTDGAPTMLGSRSGFQTLVKQRAPLASGVHCVAATATSMLQTTSQKSTTAILSYKRNEIYKSSYHDRSD